MLPELAACERVLTRAVAAAACVCSCCRFVPPPFSPQLDGLADTAYVYVPTQCQASSSNSRSALRFVCLLHPDGLTPDLTGLTPALLSCCPVIVRSYRHRSKCPVHVAFHGCSQSSGQVGDTFAQHAGYNGWAEANGIIVLYPQARANLLNPKACFDWW